MVRGKVSDSSEGGLVWLMTRPLRDGGREGTVG